MIVYRIYDPVEGEFHRSARSILDGKNGRTIWMSMDAIEVALSRIPKDIKDRLVIRAYELVEVDDLGEVD